VSDQIERSRDIIGSDLPFAQKIIGIMDTKLSLVGQANAEILQRLILQDKAIMPFIDRVYKAEIKPMWRQMLADGKKQGYIDPGLDEEALTVYLDALQAGFRARPELLRDFTENKAFLEQLTRLMFYGFLKKEIDLFHKRGKIVS
jgi:hypothetical protein